MKEGSREAVHHSVTLPPGCTLLDQASFLPCLRRHHVDVDCFTRPPLSSLQLEISRVDGSQRGGFGPLGKKQKQQQEW